MADLRHCFITLKHRTVLNINPSPSPSDHHHHRYYQGMMCVQQNFTSCSLFGCDHNSTRGAGLMLREQHFQRQRDAEPVKSLLPWGGRWALCGVDWNAEKDRTRCVPLSCVIDRSIKCGSVPRIFNKKAGQCICRVCGLYWSVHQDSFISLLGQRSLICLQCVTVMNLAIRQASSSIKGG